jgi:hypothetical protein
MRPLEELRVMACRVAAEYQAHVRTIEARWRDELDQRRRELALAHARLVRIG